MGFEPTVRLSIALAATLANLMAQVASGAVAHAPTPTNLAVRQPVLGGRRSYLPTTVTID